MSSHWNSQGYNNDDDAPEQRSMVRSKVRTPVFSKEDVALVMEGVVERIGVLRQAGQKEYAHGDPFRNFFSCGAELKTPASNVLWIHMRKHLDGILAHINGHRSQRESVDGRIQDTIVYLILLLAMDKEREQIELERATNPDSDFQLMLHGFEAP